MNDSDLDKIDKNIDTALRRNTFYEFAAIICISIFFTVGIISCVLSFTYNHAVVKVITTVAQVVVYWAVRELLKIRKLNLCIGIIPTLAIAGLSEDKKN